MFAESVNAVFRNCMVPIKIECECGQHYAFDVEPVNGRMPARVACPTCGIDGTDAANGHIARSIPSVSSPAIRILELPPQSRPGTAAADAPAPSSSTVEMAVEQQSPALFPTSVAAATATPVEPPAPTPSSIRLSVAATPVQRIPLMPSTSRPDPRLGLVDRNQAEHEARAKAMWGDSREQVISYLMVQGFSVPEATELTTKLFQERTAAVRSNGIRKIIIGFGLMCVPVIALLIFLSLHVLPLKLFGATVVVGVYGFYLFVTGILMAVAPKSEKGDVADQ